MVELVLRDARGRPVEVVADLLAVLVAPFEPHRSRTLDGNGHALDRQAAFVVGLDLLAAADDLRVDDGQDSLLVRREHEEAPQDTYLRGREPDAVRLHHQRAHPLGEALQVGVELPDRSRLHPQDRVGVLADLGERELAARLALGIQLFGANLSFDVCHGCSGHTSVVERREREAILRQGVTRPETPRDRREREALVEDLKENPLAGGELRRRLRNFRPDAGAQLAALAGPLAWMRRLRAIEIAVDLHETQLAETYAALRAEHAGDFAAEWRKLAESWDFSEVNDLIERHNRHYPAESRLPMNPRTGDFVLVNGRPYTREPLDAAWILSRFPADGQD